MSEEKELFCTCVSCSKTYIIDKLWNAAMDCASEIIEIDGEKKIRSYYGSSHDMIEHTFTKPSILPSGLICDMCIDNLVLEKIIKATSGFVDI